MRNISFCLLLLTGSILQSAWATPPSTPKDFRFEAYSRTTVELLWERSTDDVVVVNYEIARDGTVIAVVDALSLIDRDLEPDRFYVYKINAIDNEGNRSGPTSHVVTTRPATPTGLRVAVYSSTTVELFWDRPETAQPPVYEVRRDGLLQTTTDAISYLDSSLARDSLYQFSIVAKGPTGARSGSVSVTVSTQRGNALNYFSPPVQTTQTSSFLPGDDGDWQKGVPAPVRRFTANGDGTVKDNLTGLIWLTVSNCINFGDWATAVQTAYALAGDGVICDGLNDGSKAGDWRLPNVRELHSLIDYSAQLPAFSESLQFTGSGFVEFPWDGYWTSTTLAVDANVAWVVVPDLGHVTTRLKQEVLRMWAVRGGQ